MVTPGSTLGASHRTAAYSTKAGSQDATRSETVGYPGISVLCRESRHPSPIRLVRRTFLDRRTSRVALPPFGSYDGAARSPGQRCPQVNVGPPRSSSLIIALLVFGPKRLPQTAWSLRQGRARVPARRRNRQVRARPQRGHGPDQRGQGHLRRPQVERRPKSAIKAPVAAKDAAASGGSRRPRECRRVQPDAPADTPAVDAEPEAAATSRPRSPKTPWPPAPERPADPRREPDPVALTAEDRLTLFEHLDELRRRLFLSVIAVTVGVLLAAVFNGLMFEILLLPAAPGGRPARVRRPRSPPSAPPSRSWSASRCGSSAGSSWRRRSSSRSSGRSWPPRSPRARRRYFYPVVFASSMLFFAGVALGYFVVLPKGLAFCSPSAPVTSTSSSAPATTSPSWRSSSSPSAWSSNSP